MNKDKAIPNVGQGFNDSRGEVPDQKDIPKNNGQNVNNDPTHHRANEIQFKNKKGPKSSGSHLPGGKV